MARGFLSEGRRTTGDESDTVTVDLELGWATEKALGFRDPFRKDKTSSLVGGSKERLIWLPRVIRGEPLKWAGPDRSGPGKLVAPRWLLEKSGLI